MRLNRRQFLSIYLVFSLLWAPFQFALAGLGSVSVESAAMALCPHHQSAADQQTAMPCHGGQADKQACHHEQGCSGDCQSCLGHASFAMLQASENKLRIAADDVPRHLAFSLIEFLPAIDLQPPR